MDKQPDRMLTDWAMNRARSRRRRVDNGNQPIAPAARSAEIALAAGIRYQAG